MLLPWEMACPKLRSPFLHCAHVAEMPSAPCAVQLGQQIELEEVLRTPMQWEECRWHTCPAFGSSSHARQHTEI